MSKKKNKPAAEQVLVTDTTDNQSQPSAEEVAAHQQQVDSYAVLQQEQADLDNVPPAPTAEPQCPPDSFEAHGARWQFAVTHISLPKIGKRTALEALLDDTEYPHLGGATIRSYLAGYGSKALRKLPD